MMKPVNHHYSVLCPVHPTKMSTDMKSVWFCTLAYNQDNKCLGIAVVGSKDQFCRRRGADIAYARTLAYPLTGGRFVCIVKDDEELKDILVSFRKAKSITEMWSLIIQYFPLFRTRRMKQSKVTKSANIKTEVLLGLLKTCAG
ncbi:hypothetical protein UFOVP276_17 [uncultured Caudovirales phage]|uniref:Uncharacterized protein n=1 Tax=uncultured Caudovirales phage TaxID=2100421 RepID=A0A6J5LJT7_9CAUD|nr:hypothetical protein UFOVP127_154 [uncultured Caudovirales phage]CAB4134824.1 hypothetical protein UFOVP276_17 [uncultured Caudovirales phage]